MPDAERLTDERVREIAEDRAVAFHTDELRALAREVLAARRTDATAPLSDEEREFAAWLTREMPPGTVIGNPEWWAVRIWSQLSRLAARAGDREGEPMVAVDWPGNPSFLYGWVTMWLEVNRRYLPADQCDLLIAQMDRFYDANGRNREIVEWASRAAPGGETRKEANDE